MDRPYYPPGNPMSIEEYLWHEKGWIAGSMLEAWKEGQEAMEDDDV